MIDNFQAIIGATIKDFTRKMKEVDRKIRDTATGADVNIGADIAEFMAKMNAADAKAKQALKRDEKNIGADISSFLRKAAEVAVVARALTRDKVIVPIQASWKNYQNVMGRIASFNRAMGEIMQMTMQGIKISLSPAIVPIIASLVGLLGQLGPMLGTIGGSTFALGTAFATAGIGAAAFGAIAVTNLKDIFGASSDLKKLQKKLDDTTDIKERAKILEKIKNVQGSLNSEQTKALSSMNKLKETWTGIAKGLETKTIQIFTEALDIFGGVLTTLTPMFTSVTDAVGRMMTSLGQAVKSDSMVAFFDYLNKSAGPMLETISKSFGNFMKGFFSMMEAFGPLAEDTAAGFLKMSEGFATWAAGLGESKKFQSFVDYVKENMPKIKSIFGDAILGMVNTFSAFAPSSADMMTSLQDMMARFKEWSSTLSENQGFQNFIAYIKENGPKVVELIGNITTFLVNLGTALAPMGSVMLDVINKFLEWSSAMIENHPWVGKVMAAVLVLGGAFLAALPHIVGMIALFGGLTGPMAVASAKMIATAATFIGKWALMGVKAMASAIEQVAAWALATGRAMVTAVASMATTAATFVAKWLLIGAQAMVHAAKVAAAWLLSTGAAMVTAVGSMIATSATFVAKWTWMAVQSLAQAARMAAAWFIALGPVGWVIGAIVGLAILVIANWDKIKAATIKIWTSVSGAVKKAWNNVKEKTVEAVKILGEKIAEMPGKVKEFASDMLSAGGDLIMGLIKGITGMAGKALDAIAGVVGSVIGKAKSLLKIASPSKVFTEIGAFMGVGMAIGITSTQSANEKAITGVSKVLSAAARNNAVEVAKIATDAEKKRTEIQKEYASKRADLERKSDQSAQTALKSSTNKNGQTTSAGTQRIHNIHADAAVNLAKLKSDEQKKLASISEKAWADMAKKESEVSKARLEAAKTYVADKKSLDQLSLVAESEIWRKSIVLFKEGTKERVEAQKAYQTALSTINDNIVKTNDEYAGKMSEVNSRLRKEEEDLTNSYVKSLDDRAASLTNFIGIFDFFEVKVEKTGGDLLNNLKSQVSGFVDWQREIEMLAKKAIDGGLLAELREMGPKALPELLALNTMTDTQLSEYSKLYQQKSELARKQAESELVGMKADTAKQITALRGVANAELETLRVEWVDKIKLVTKGTEEEFGKMTRSMKSIGTDTIAGLMAGMDEMKGPLMQQAQSIADSVAATMRLALQVKSPSRIMMAIGRFVSEGLAIGIADEAKAVIKTVVDMATGVTNAFNPQLAMPLMDLQMSPLDTSGQIESLKRQIKQELSVDMSVTHSGGVGGVGGGFNQEVHLHSPKALSPSENARSLERVGRQQAMEWGHR